MSKKANSITLVLYDDGKGLNETRILSKAKEAGILKEGEQLNNKTIERIIFTSGFSTAENVTEISGRGVGMDAIKSFTESVGGTIQMTLGTKKNSASEFIPVSFVLTFEANETEYLKVS